MGRLAIRVSRVPVVRSRAWVERVGVRRVAEPQATVDKPDEVAPVAPRIQEALRREVGHREGRPLAAARAVLVSQEKWWLAVAPVGILTLRRVDFRALVGTMPMAGPPAVRGERLAAARQPVGLGERAGSTQWVAMEAPRVVSR